MQIRRLECNVVGKSRVLHRVILPVRLFWAEIVPDNKVRVLEAKYALSVRSKT